MYQRGWGWVAKGEWNAVVTDRALFEVRAGEFGVDRTQDPNGTAPRFEDVGTLVVRGANRNWRETVHRPQVLGSFTWVNGRWLGSHDLKVGGQILRTTVTEAWKEAFAGNVLHVLRNGSPIEVYVFGAPSRSTSGLWTYHAYGSDAWRVNDRLSLSLGLRFDRTRLFLPAQTHPVGRFNPVAQTFAAVGNLIDWNSIAPRAGLILDVSGHGRTVVKVNYGRYWLSPGPELGFDANPNANQWWRRHTWADTNHSGVWEQSEEGRLLGSRGGLALESLDPGLEPALLDEVTASVERELPARLGVRTGIVWRSERQHWMRRNTNQPIEAFTVPVAIADPGPDGKVGTGDDGPLLAGYDLAPEFLSRPPVNIVRNVPGADSSHWTWEATATRRYSDGWSLAAGFDYTWSRDQGSGYSGQGVRNNTYPLTPNDLINAGTSGQYQFGTWSAKVSGTYDGPWNVRVSPLLRHQSGQPYGRTFSTGLRYGTVRILAEPIGTRRMDNVTIVDVRVEKGFTLAGNRRVAAIVDVFNLLNANPEQNVSWSSGSFLRPLAIVAPRIVRIGGKLEW